MIKYDYVLWFNYFLSKNIEDCFFFNFVITTFYCHVCEKIRLAIYPLDVPYIMPIVIYKLSPEFCGLVFLTLLMIWIYLSFECMYVILDDGMVKLVNIPLWHSFTTAANSNYLKSIIMN